MRKLLAIVALMTLSACASPRGRANVARVGEVAAATALAVGTGYAASGMICYHYNEFSGPNLDSCDQDMFMAIPYAIAGNVLFWIFEPMRKNAMNELKAQGEIQMTEEEYNRIIKDFCKKDPKNLACNRIAKND